MQFHMRRDANAVAEKAAEIITSEAHSALSARGQITFAVSGGQTSWRMLRTVSAKELPWRHLFVNLLQRLRNLYPTNIDHSRSAVLHSPIGKTPGLSEPQLHVQRQGQVGARLSCRPCRME